MTVMKFGMGQPARRLEDAALLKGEGRFASDLLPKGCLRAVLVRAPYAHARFTIKDTSAAAAMKGVRLILTHKDVAHLAPLPLQSVVPNADGSAIVAPPYEILCSTTVKHVGDAVAMVVADTLAQAKDAAEAIVIDWEPLPVVADAVAALKPGAPQVWPDKPGNLAGTIEVGEAGPVEKAFAKADRVVELTVINNRLVTNYMETRACFAEYDRKKDHYTLTLGSQGSHSLRDVLARVILKIKREQLRLITPDVGGGFGTKMFMFREYPLVLVAAKAVGKPVAWISDRNEHFMACSQGRDNVSTARAALDARGRIIGLKVDTVADLGAYLGQYSTYIPFVGAAMLAGTYAIPAVHGTIRLAYTNTVPVDAYRGAGRPEAAYLVERLMDEIARQTGLKRETVRRRNFIKPAEMPWKTPLGKTYDSGEFDAHMTRAMELADWDGFPARQKAAKKRGMLRGIGLATYIEACGGGAAENAWATLEKDGTVTVKVGSQSSGQGHLTAYAQIASQHLDLPLERIKVLQGDTDIVRSGTGTGGSRSIPVGGVAVDGAASTLAKRIKELAATEMEVGVGDVEIDAGSVRVVGTDKVMDFAAVAALKGGADLKDINASWAPPEATYPNGTHVVEVEIDPETGATSLERYIIVDDFGVTLNPLMLAGQVHGGVAQGIGQALLERTVYDQESGQLLTATFMDYAMPRADHVPPLHFETRNVRCTTNLLGFKGAGEAGAIGSCPAVMNAVSDALYRGCGVTRIDMPATPQAIWDAIREARGKVA